MSGAGHWPQAARRWSQVGPPLRPSEADVACFREAIVGAGPRVLLLGVTPELYHLPWAEGTDLIAVDRSQAMIDLVWPGPRDAVRCAHWTELPLGEASVDLVLCDGGLGMLAFPATQARLAVEVHRVLRPGGRCVFRLFAPPPERESPRAVIDDLVAGRVESLEVLKLRLWTALQDTVAEGVAVRRVWEAVRGAASDLDALGEQIGWPVDRLGSLDVHRDSDAVYHLSGVAEVRELFGALGFEVASVQWPAHAMSQWCPVISLRRL